MGFVDIHSHILYGIDDGAKTFDESLQMLQIAAEAGTTDIVATPHADGRYCFDPELIDHRISELSAHVDVRIHHGCDFHLQPDNIEDALAHPRKYTINRKNYLLIEFPDLAIFSSADEVLLQLLDAGIVPIVTHPERNAQLMQKVDDLARWIEMGCYVQVTGGSCTGMFGNRVRRSAEGLIGRGLVHFIASDAHDHTHRSPDLRGAYASLSDRWGEQVIRPLFVDNPRAVLTGDTVDFEMPARAAGRRKWYCFW